jgi:hypothetical protein
MPFGAPKAAFVPSIAPDVRCEYSGFFCPTFAPEFAPKFLPRRGERVVRARPYQARNTAALGQQRGAQDAQTLHGQAGIT